MYHKFWVIFGFLDDKNPYAIFDLMDFSLNTDIINLLLGSGILLVLIRFVFNIGEFNNRFVNVEKKVEKMDKSLGEMKKDIRSFKTKVNNWSKDVDKTLEDHDFRIRNISFLKSKSPAGLKEEFIPLVTESGMAEQLEENNEKLVKWVKRQKPKNGLEAQDAIVHLVMSGKIHNYVDPEDYYQKVYEEGYLSSDAKTILGLYLFEKLIPQIIE